MSINDWLKTNIKEGGYSLRAQETINGFKTLTLSTDPGEGDVTVYKIFTGGFIFTFDLYSGIEESIQNKIVASFKSKP